jgi:hypothetical protein
MHDQFLQIYGQNVMNRIYRVLTMVYNSQNYWVSGLCPSSGILNTIKHDVSEIVSVSVLSGPVVE